MKRQYLPIADYPVYNNAVDMYSIQSDILNGGGMAPGLHSILMTKDNMTGLLIELEGDKDGDFRRDDEYERAAIPFIKGKLKELEKRFIEYQNSQVKQGYEEPCEMPQRMLDEFYTLQARLTVLIAESEELRKRLQVYKDKEQQEDDSKVLFYGLQGWATFHTDPRLLNILQFIDRQRITQTEDGLLIINDNRSPYSGMSVADYRSLCKTYYEQQKIKEREKLKQVQEECRIEGNPIPNHLGAHALHRVSRESLIPWPDGVKNYLAKESSPFIKHMIRK
jgi:hypothetical protein